MATSGREALEWVESEDFDIILLDIMMSGMDGYEVCDKIILAATDVIACMKLRNQDAATKNKVPWKIRIGIHTGKVASGIVGIHKYAYNVFGDTVNTASRMETYSEPMRINVSELTYNIVKDKFSFIERNPIDVKGKGMMKMFFLGDRKDSNMSH